MWLPEGGNSVILHRLYCGIRSGKSDLSGWRTWGRWRQREDETHHPSRLRRSNRYRARQTAEWGEYDVGAVQLKRAPRRHLLPCLVHCWPGQNLQDARCCQLRGGSGQWRQFCVLVQVWVRWQCCTYWREHHTGQDSVTALAEGSLEDAAMVISFRKCKVMHIHRIRRVDATT